MPRRRSGFADVVIVAVKPGQVGPVVGPLREALRHKIVVSVGRRRDVRGLRADAGARYAAPLDRAQYAGRRRRRDRRLRKAAFTFGGGVAVRRAAVVARRTGATGRYPAAGRRRDGLRLRSAFAAMFVEALADAAVMHGIPRADAYRMASQMIVGTGKLQLASGTHPGAMKDAVCSPGGTTIRGVAELERRGFRGAVIDAVDAIEGKR